MKYAYPAIFTPLEDEKFDVKIPDLPGCRAFGEGLADAIFMAEDAASIWLWDAERRGEPIPDASRQLQAAQPQFVNFIYADTDQYRRRHDSRAVKKTLSIPAWLNSMAEARQLNFSAVLQPALIECLNAGLSE